MTMTLLHSSTTRRVACLVGAAILMTGAGGASELPDWAKQVEPTVIRDLGGPNRLSDKPLTDVASLQAFFVAERDRLERGLADAEWPGDPDDLFAAVERGEVEELMFPVGGQLPWMMLHDRTTKTDVIHKNVVWQGKKPFDAFLLRFESSEFRWAFVVPKECANLSLFSQMGTGVLSVSLLSGTANLFDPEGNPIVIGAGESGTVSATWQPRPHSDEAGTPQVPSSVRVEEGAVEFTEYGRPISLLVADGNTMSAVLQPDGSMSLSVPGNNPNPMPIKVGDAVGTISAGAGMAVAWPTPECRLAMTTQPDCTPGTMEIDASASTVAGGWVKAVEMKLHRPDGEVVPVQSGAGPLSFNLQLESAGSYRVSAVAISDKGRRSTNDCSLELELPACVPPPPSCAITVDAEIISTFESVRFDAAGSSSQGGTVEAVVVALYTELGKNRGLVEVEAPFTGEFDVTTNGRYILKAVAVDQLGQASTNSCEATITVRPRTGYSLWGFGGYGRRTPDTSRVVDSGWIAGGKVSFDRRISRSFFEISLGAGIDFNSAVNDVKLFSDLEVNWVRDWGFLGGGFGVWDLTDSEFTGSNLQIHAGWKLPWQVGRGAVHLTGEMRLFLDEMGNVNDNFLTLVGLRFRP